MTSKETLLLLTNDDGVMAPGLQALQEALAEVATTHIIAPDRERSAVSHSFTMHVPLRATDLEAGRTMLTGTPADCVIFGLKGYLKRRPEMVVSGINAGPNMGIDAYYSGTVAAAHQAVLLGIPGVAVSLDNRVWHHDDQDRRHYEAAAGAAARVVARLLQCEVPEGVFFNINVPNLPMEELAGVQWTTPGRRIYRDQVILRQDPIGRKYYWIGGDSPTWESVPGSDFDAVESGYVSVTPMQWTLGGSNLTEGFADWDISLKS
jgi:5'-nucleotidase